MEFISHSVSETELFADKVASICKGNEIILLEGDLGAGKTTFTKGFAKALGITANVTSPTFTLMKSYSSGRLPLYHFDLYRITDEDELAELGFEEFFESGGVCMIEWNKFTDIKGKIIKIKFIYCGDETRKIVAEGL